MSAMKMVTLFANGNIYSGPASCWVKAIREDDGKEFNPSAGFQVK